MVDRFIKSAELYPPSFWKYLSNEFCSLTKISKDICLLFEFAVSGYDFAQFNGVSFVIVLILLSYHFFRG